MTSAASPTVIHVNQAVIRANRVTGAREPALTLKKGRGGKVTRAHEAVARDEEGNEVFRVVYRPDDPLPCGAACWVETTLRVTPLINTEDRMAKTNGGTAAKTPPAVKPAAKPKAVTHELTLNVKAPADMTASRIQRAVQAVLDEGMNNIETATGDVSGKVIDDLDKVVVGKVKVRRPAPSAPPEAAPPVPQTSGQVQE